MDCHRGVWVGCNKFITEYGTELRVVPFSQLINRYKDKLPLKCFMLLEGNTIKDIVEDNLEQF